MVYAISYQPNPESYPSFEALDGDRSKIRLEDESRDGGVGIYSSQIFSGRRLREDHIPTRISWCSKRSLQDLEGTWLHSVNERLRSIIEEIEPGVHQFIPVKFVAKDGCHLGHRFFWQVCNRLDSIHRGKTNWTLKDGVVWFPPEDEQPRLVFDISRIGVAKFWHDKHRTEGPYITDCVHQRLEDAGITGIRYHHYSQI